MSLLTSCKVFMINYCHINGALCQVINTDIMVLAPKYVHIYISYYIICIKYVLITDSRSCTPVCDSYLFTKMYIVNILISDNYVTYL